jgi:isochorismate synthase
LGEQLLASAKDRHEHEVVVRTVVEALGPLCDQLDVGATPSLLKLGNVQHLYTPVTGHLCSACTLLNVVERLHPTPAVGGRPREAALALIREREGFDRGWYGGPVGWIDQRGEGEFAVAIRSALLHGTQATLFAGCGIVADSDPEREYAEAALKLKPMLSALGAE